MFWCKMRIFLVVLVLVSNNFVDVESNTSYCQDISKSVLRNDRYDSQDLESRNISLYWDSEPARAAASLLEAFLRHVLGYKYVQLQHSSSQNPEADCQLNGQLKEVKLELSTGQTTGNQVIMLEVELMVHLAEDLQDEEQWTKITEWNLYNGTTNLTNYGFSYSNISGNLNLNVFIIQPHEPSIKAMVEALIAQTNTSLLQLQFKELNMTDFFHTSRNQNQSFLYIGYNMWADEENIKIVESPIQKLTTNIAIHIADDCLLKEELPEDIEIISEKYELSLKELRELLELEISEKNYEEAACKWISKHNTNIDSLVQEYEPIIKKYLIVTIFCKDNTEEERILNSLHTHLGYQINKKYESKYSFGLDYTGDNCSDTNYLMERLLKNNDTTPSTIGVILDGVRNVKEYNVVKALDGIGVPVLVYNTADIDVNETTSVWLTSGRTLHLVLALHQLITTNNWMRIHVLSDPTTTAERYITELTQLGGLKIINHKLERNIKQSQVEKILRNFKPDNIIFVNTNYEDAATILLAAESLNKSENQNFTFIIRDWRPNISTKNISHYTISHSYSDVKNTSIIVNWDETEDKWPAQATALTDAMLILLHGFENVIKKYPQAQYGPQSKEVMTEFQKSLNDPNGIEGVFQNLRFKGHSVEETAVYLDLWHGDHRERKARWSVNTTSLAATVEWGSTNISGCNRSLSNYSLLLTIALSCLVKKYF